MTSTVIFRADASAAIGLGHAMRCRALAEAVVERGGQAIFGMVNPPSAVARAMTAAPALLELLPGSPGGRSDLAALLDLVAMRRPCAVVVDGYHFSEDYLSQLSRQCPLVIIDDLAALDRLPCRMVLNASPSAPHLPYDRLAPDALKLLGTRYVLLRRDIRLAMTAPRLPLADRTSVLVTFGGSDPLALTIPVVQALASRLPEAVRLDVLVGAGNSRISDIRVRARHLGRRVRLVVDPPSVTPLFAAAGLAITAAGGTVAELAALGVPALAVLVATNQEGASADGPYPRVDGRGKDAVTAITETAIRLWHDLDARTQLGLAAGGLLDGHGALRVADAILALFDQPHQGLRPL